MERVDALVSLWEHSEVALLAVVPLAPDRTMRDDHEAVNGIRATGALGRWLFRL